VTTGAIRRDRAPSASPLLLFAGAVVAGVTLIPLGWVVWSTAQLGLGDAVDFLARPRVGELLWNTVRLLVATVALSAVLGVGCAWLVERSGVRAKGLWHGLMAAPLAVPAFVNGYGWVSTTHAVQSYPGAVLVVSLSYYPLVYLPTVATLRRVDPGLEEVAAALGRKPWGVFFRVVLPTISPGVLGGCLLVGLHVLGEYGALQLLNYPTLTTSILDQFRSTFNGPAAALLAAVLAAFCLVLAVLELYAAGRRRRARVGAGAPRTGAATSRSPWPARVGGVVLPFVALLALAVPLGSLVRWMVRGTSTSFPAGDLGAATLSTAGLALAAGVLAAVAAAPLALLAVRHRGWPAMFLERSTYIASSLPGIVVALALVTVTIHLLPALYQTLPVLVVGYVILFLPRAVVSLRSTLELAPPVLEDVARSLGCGSLATARRVTLPLVLPGVTSGVALVALAAATELTATLLLAPIGVTTLSTEFWARASAVEYGAAAPYALLLVVLSVPATWLLSRLATGETRALR